MPENSVSPASSSSSTPRPSTLESRTAVVTAVLMVLTGIGLSVAAFVRSPSGHISDSVLWFVAQALVYAGSIFGVGVYIDGKLGHLGHHKR